MSPAACMLRYNFSFPMLLDTMDNDAEVKYQSWPDRLFIIDREGKIVTRVDGAALFRR